MWRLPVQFGPARTTAFAPRNERHSQPMVNQTPLVSLTKSLPRNMYFASRRPQCTQDYCENMTQPPYPQHLNPKLTPAIAEDVAFLPQVGLPRRRRCHHRGAGRDPAHGPRRGLRARGQQAVYPPALRRGRGLCLLLLDNPPVLERMQAILGTCVQLHSATARITESGQEDQNWHRDVPWPIDPDGTPYGALPGQINCGYYLDELDEDNGAIVIVPGSHRAPFRPPEGHPRFPEEKRVFARPGQAVMFDGCLYHRGAANRSAVRRRVCLMCYQTAWMKSREPFDGPFAQKIRAQRVLTSRKC